MDFIDSIIAWLKGLFNDLVEFITELPLLILDGILSALASIIEAIPMPDFMTGGLQEVVDVLPSSVLWLMANAGIGAALGIIAAGVGFRLLRKVVTLFQW